MELAQVHFFYTPTGIPWCALVVENDMPPISPKGLPMVEVSLPIPIEATVLPASAHNTTINVSDRRAGYNA